MSSHRRLTTAQLGAALALTLVLAGCGGDEPDPGAGPATSEGTSDGTSGGTGSSDPTEPTEPTGSEDGEPTVAASSGRVFETEHFTVNAPKGWRESFRTRSSTEFASGPPKGDGPITEADASGFVSVEASPESVAQSLDEAARGSYEPYPRRPDTSLGGEAAYHLASRNQGVFTDEEFGLWYDGVMVRVGFRLTGGSRGDRQQLIGSVLASWQWK